MPHIFVPIAIQDLIHSILKRFWTLRALGLTLLSLTYPFNSSFSRSLLTLSESLIYIYFFGSHFQSVNMLKLTTLLTPRFFANSSHFIFTLSLLCLFLANYIFSEFPWLHYGTFEHLNCFCAVIPRISSLYCC